MSSSNPSDPRLLLPDWLRDGDVPAAAKVASEPPPVVQWASVAEIVEVEPVIAQQPAPVALPVTPYAERLSLDTRLDPGQLVSAEDLPKWLGGLERVAAAPAPTAVPRAQTAPVQRMMTIEEPEPYEGVDAPADGVIDVQVNGWILIAGAVGLFILLAAALKLYLS